MIGGFETRPASAGSLDLNIAIGGVGPPLLLLHGFPETHLMWRQVAPTLAGDFTVICADLPGQGASDIPQDDLDPPPFSKRGMSLALVEMMRRLGHERFSVVGHDRGGRVAYRMALDHPDAVGALAVLDVVPIADAWMHADERLARAFWPWSLLSQPSPLPERLVVAAPEAVVDDAVTQWGTPPSCFPEWVRAAFVAPLRNPHRVHAVCEEFRCAATLDREHDEADRKAGRTIVCPTLIIWDEEGAVGTWYEAFGGPLGLWRQWAPGVVGQAMSGGHFFPEARPDETAAALRDFFLFHAR